MYIYIYIVVRRRKNSRTERDIELKFTPNILWKISSSTVVFSTPHFHWFKRCGPWKLGNAHRKRPKYIRSQRNTPRRREQPRTVPPACPALLTLTGWAHHAFTGHTARLP